MESTCRFAVATAIAAACLVSSSDAGLVGTNCSMRLFDGPSGTTYLTQSFVVSNLLPEFYYGSSFPGGQYGAFSGDVKSSSLTVTMDFDFPPGQSLIFLAGTRLELTIPASMQFDSFSLGASSDVTGLSLGDISGAGTRTLLLDTSLIAGTAPGANFTINFTTSAVPGPSALVILSAFAAIPSRRRRG